ncbi:MAG: TolC family protein [Proteobacteria bacterium]|nr:TolC family protein [Pseudomonadota bacterium]
MKNFNLFSLIAIVILLFEITHTAHAEEGSIGIEEVVKKTLDNSQLVKEIEAAYLNKNAEALETKTLSNPTLDAELAVPLAWNEARGENEISLSITQPFKLSQVSLRSRLAELLYSVANSEKEQEVIELIVKTKLSFARLWLLSERERILKEFQPKTKSITQFVNTGLKQGAYGQGDEALFRTEIAKSEAELLGIQAELISAEAEMTRLAGQSFKNQKLKSPSISSTLSVEQIQSRLSNGEVKMQGRARILADLAKANLEVATSDAFPELRPSLVYSKTNDGVDIVGIGLSVDLPLFSQNNSEQMRKRADYNAAEAKFSNLRSEAFKLSVINSVRSYQLRLEELRLYETKVIPAIKESLSAFEKQVRNGQGSVFQLWQTLREYLNIQERYLELWTMAFSEQQELAILIGEEI